MIITKMSVPRRTFLRGVGAAIAYTVGHLGIGILVNLAKLLATMYVAVAAFIVGVLLPVALMARVPLQPGNQLKDFLGANARAAARGYCAACGDESYAWKVAVGPGIDAANRPQDEATDYERKNVGFRAPKYTVFAWCWWARLSQSLR